MSKAKWYRKPIYVLVVLALVLSVGIVALPMAGTVEANGIAWTEHSGNPVFGEGVGGPKAYYPSVLYDADSFSGHGVSAKYKMWCGTSGSQTGLAISDDGITWTNQGVVMTDGYHATVEYYSAGFAGVNSGDNPSSATMYYRMWYWDVPTLYDVSAIGYSESADGVSWYNYQPLQNKVGGVPIVSGGDPWWNRGSYGPCDVLYNPGASNEGTDWTFTMYYDGTTGGDEAIGLGFSSDGITWTGYDADSDGKADPVLNGTYVGGDWDYNYVSRATIIKNADDDYEMWYSGGNGTMNHGIGSAISSDGMYWTRDTNNPVFHLDDGVDWRDERTYCPAVLKDGSSYKMWFAGKGSAYSIGYASVPAPSEVWVDDDWANLSRNDPADGHIFGYDAFATIQDGVDAVAGSTVHVAAGTYDEEVVIDKSLTLISDTGDYRTTGAILNGPIALSDVVNVTIEGFKFQDCSSSGYKHVIYTGGTADNITIVANSFDNCEGLNIHIYRLDTWFENWTITDNKITNVTGTDRSGIWVQRLRNSIISNNEISNTTYAGMILDRIEKVTVSNNNISNTPKKGIQVASSPNCNVVIENNYITNTNTSHDADEGAITIYPDVTNIHIENNTLTANYQGFTVRDKSGTVSDVYVNFNNIYGNDGFGVGNFAQGGGMVDATNNWWGSPTGPYRELPNAKWVGKGDKVSGNVDYIPWLPH